MEGNSGRNQIEEPGINNWDLGLLKETRLHEDHSVVVLTIKKLTGDMIYNPKGESILEAGHILVVVGHRGQMKGAKHLGRAKEE